MSHARHRWDLTKRSVEEARETIRGAHGRHFEEGVTVDALRTLAEAAFAAGARAQAAEDRETERKDHVRKVEQTARKMVDESVIALLALMADEVPISTLDVMVDVAPLVDTRRVEDRFRPLADHLVRPLSGDEKKALEKAYEPRSDGRPEVVYRDRVITRRESGAGAFALGFFLGTGF